jgi:photosystem II stability/assembly factor-like uncharacterized protein
MRASRVLGSVLALLLAISCQPFPASGAGPGDTARKIAWEPLGISGGGAMYTPAISPCDGNLMMVNCDMSGAYVSTDGGSSWRMIHHSQLRSNTRCRPAFHPAQPGTIFAVGGWSGGLKVSRDFGLHWEETGNLPRDLAGEIAIDPGQPERMLAGTSKEVWRSQDGCKTWTRCEGPRGTSIGFHFDQTSPADKRVCFAATAEGIWRSDDGGATWAEKSAGLPWRGLRSFCGGSNAADKTILLYCAVPGKAVEGKYEGGIYRSADRGETWQSAMAPAINMDIQAADQWAMGPVAQYHRVLTTNVKPSVVWAFNANTGVRPPHQTAAYRSDDGGKTWRATFYPDPRYTPCNVEQDYETAGVRQFYQGLPEGAAIDPSNPDHVMQVDGGRCYITTNGGKAWFPAHTRLTGSRDPTSKDAAWLCTGLVVTTTWNYYLDPFEPKRQYICYTDIGFARSLDAGKSWKWWSVDARSPWSNTCYELAFDPNTPGKVWGAFSNVHDIPNANIISGRHRAAGEGGICLSLDFGQTWKPVCQGLPKAPVLSVVVDPKSPAGSRTLYASVFGQGVFKSADGGKTWEKASQGLGAAENMRTCRLQLHAYGSLFVLITAMRKDGKFLSEGVGLYRSRDGAKTWELVNRSQPLLWPKDFTVDPKDSRTIYVGTADAGGKKEGGLWATKDGGATWKLLARKGPEHFGAYPHPKRPGWIFMTLTEDAPGAGLWLSKDGGATWAAMDGLPFANAQRVAFDPADENVIYVTTFGGSVWRGPASE